MVKWIGNVILVMVVAASVESAAAAEGGFGRYVLPSHAEAQRAYEQALNDIPRPASLRRLHELMCAEPHPVGTAGERRMITKLQRLFEQWGVPVELQRIETLIAEPVSASVTVETFRVYPEGDRALAELEERLELPVRGEPVPGDPYSADENLRIGWNAYSGSGEAAGQVVYANYGTKEDFETLERLGITVEGRIVLARYGRNFRGYKAKFAEQAGAEALLIYTDPADSGYVRGPMYPDGGWANGHYIQNGSIKTLDYPGDPLTPGWEAAVGEDVERLDVNDVALPGIPVQPIGWSAAHEIMKRMTGPSLPKDIRSGWQGGLPMPYRLAGGPTLQVRVSVDQRRLMARTANVLGIIRGARYPEQMVIVGCHFDAWTFGAGDPHAGSIVLMEMARSFAAAAEQGMRPARTVVFANWAAEEFGIIGSTEWVEAHRDELAEDAVAYVNLDMAAMGPNFRASSSPMLKSVISGATRDVPQAGGETGQVIFDSWTGDPEEEPSFGTLGGGSDHVGLYCHVGVPSCGLGAGGSDGVSYHSNYDNIAWYRKVVGSDYEPALMLTRLGNVLVSRLANADVLPLDPARYAKDMRKHLDAAEREGEQAGMTIDDSKLRAGIDQFERVADEVSGKLALAIETDALDEDDLAAINDVLRTLERCWIAADGLKDRPWYRNRFAATDPYSGYGAWMLPALRLGIERNDGTLVDEALEQYSEVFRTLTEQMRVIGARLES